MRRKHMFSRKTSFEISRMYLLTNLEQVLFVYFYQNILIASYKNPEDQFLKCLAVDLLTKINSEFS